MAGIKESLGKFNITPPLDFDTAGSLDYTPPETEHKRLIFRGSLIILAITPLIIIPTKITPRTQILNNP